MHFIGNYIKHKIQQYLIIYHIIEQRNVSAIKIQSYVKGYLIRKYYNNLYDKINQSYQLFCPNTDIIKPYYKVECKQYMEAFNLQRIKIHNVKYCPLRKAFVIDIPKSHYKHSSHKIIRFCFYINNTAVINQHYFSICIDGTHINQYDFTEMDSKIKEMKRSFLLFKRNFFPRRYSLTPTISLINDLRVCPELLFMQNLTTKTSVESFSSINSFDMLQLGSDNEDEYDCPILKTAANVVLPQLNGDIKDIETLHKEMKDDYFYKRLPTKKRFSLNTFRVNRKNLKSILKERKVTGRRINDIEKSRKERRVKFGTVEFSI